MHRSEIPNDYVAMAEHLCPACGTKHTFNTEILIHTRLQSIPKNKRVTGWGPCKDCHEKFEQGYLALVEAMPPNGTCERMQPDEANRTGKMMFIRREAAAEIFNVTLDKSIAFVEPGVIDRLAEMYTRDTGNAPPVV